MVVMGKTDWSDVVQDLLRFNDVDQAALTAQGDVLTSVTEEESSDTGLIFGLT